MMLPTKAPVPFIIDRVAITDRCDAPCTFCYTKKSETHVDIDAQLLIKFFEKNKEWYQEEYYGEQNQTPSHQRFKIMGGDPLLHPKFEKITVACLENFGATTVFTNGHHLDAVFRNSDLLYFFQQGTLRIEVNAECFDTQRFLSIKDELLIEDDHRIKIMPLPIHYTIPNDESKIDSTVASIFEIINSSMVSLSLPNGTRKNEYLVNIILSINTTVDIFNATVLQNYKGCLSKTIQQLSLGFYERKLDDFLMYFNHVTPYCFWDLDLITEIKNHIHPSASGAFHFMVMNSQSCFQKNIHVGLLLPDFSISFCNHALVPIGSLLDKKGKVVRLEDLSGIYEKAVEKKHQAIAELPVACNTCPSHDSCLMGCFYNSAWMHQSKNNPVSFPFRVCAIP